LHVRLGVLPDGKLIRFISTGQRLLGWRLINFRGRAPLCQFKKCSSNLQNVPFLFWWLHTNKTKRFCFSCKAWFQSGFCALAVGSRLNGLKSYFWESRNFWLVALTKKEKTNQSLSSVWFDRSCDREQIAGVIALRVCFIQKLIHRGHSANCIHHSRKWYLWALWKRRSKSLPSIVQPVQLQGTTVRFRSSRCRASTSRSVTKHWTVTIHFLREKTQQKITNIFGGWGCDLSRAYVSPGRRASPSTCRVLTSDGLYSGFGRWCTFGRTAGRATWPWLST